MGFTFRSHHFMIRWPNLKQFFVALLALISGLHISSLYYRHIVWETCLGDLCTCQHTQIGSGKSCNVIWSMKCVEPLHLNPQRNTKDPTKTKAFDWIPVGLWQGLLRGGAAQAFWAFWLHYPLKFWSSPSVCLLAEAETSNIKVSSRFVLKLRFYGAHFLKFTQRCRAVVQWKTVQSKWGMAGPGWAKALMDVHGLCALSSVLAQGALPGSSFNILNLQSIFLCW